MFFNGVCLVWSAILPDRHNTSAPRKHSNAENHTPKCCDTLYVSLSLKAELGRAACELLVGLTDHGAAAATKLFATALHKADGDFDGDLLKAAAAGEGGECLRGGSTLSNILQALKEVDDERRKAEEEATAAGEGEQGGDPFEGVPETGADGVDAGHKKLVQEYGEALSDLVHTQVRTMVVCIWYRASHIASVLFSCSECPGVWNEVVPSP